MKPNASCARCGQPLDAELPGGLCSACALNLAIEVGAAPAGQPATGRDSAASPAVAAAPVAEGPGAVIGRYKLLQKIGEGGCGVVYMAEQEEPVHRRVALKVIKLGMDTKEVIARFEVERQALALMDHPNIAKVLDAGATETGRPYFVMELVRGIRITQFCDQNNLSTRERLDLFTKVCQAVQHAHQKGIIHRDIKPSNVLVASHDGVPVPKVIDFGIAKATGGRLTDKTYFTAFEQFIGTPAYMSPEQAELSGLDIDTRTDIYSLGVLLYELLAGSPPFDPKKLADAGLDEIRRIIREVEPPKPSTRLTQDLVAGDVRRVASKSDTRDPKSEQDRASSRRLLQAKRELIRLLRGDLDWIVMKCLEKDRARRYETANGLVMDLKRHLSHEPVVARPPSTAYRFQKLVRRNQGLFAAAAVVVALLLVMAIGAMIAAVQLQRKDERTQAALWNSHLAEAQLRRASGQAGQRFRALEVLAQAAAIRPTVALRNEAIACLTLPDWWELDRIECPEGANLRFDSRLTTYVQHDRLGTNRGHFSIRSTASRRELARVPIPHPGADCLLSPDGRFLAVTQPNPQFQIWDWAKGELILQTEVPPRGFPADFHPDGHRVAVGLPDGRVLFYDLTQRTTVGTYDVGFPANRLRFHPDGKLLAVANIYGRDVLILDLEQGGKEIARLRQPGETFGGLDWSADGKQLAVGCIGKGGSHLVQVWDWEAGKETEKLVLRGHQAEVIIVRFLPNRDLLLTGSTDGTTRLWSTHTGRQLLRTTGRSPVTDPRSHRLAFQVLPTAYSIEELVTGREHRLLPGHTGGKGPYSVDFSPDGQLVASAGADGVRLWHAPTGQPLGLLPGGGSISALFHPVDGSLLVAAGERVLRWPVTRSAAGDVLTVGPAETVSGPKPRGPYFRIAASQDGTRLACVANGQAEILDWRNPSDRKILSYGGTMTLAALSPDGAWAVTCGDGPFKVWHVDREEIVAELSRPGYALASFSPDGRWLVLSSRGLSGGVGGGHHHIHRVGTWELKHEVTLDHGVWPPSAFAPDGRMLAVRISRSGVRLLDTRTWTELATIDVPDQELMCWLSFSPDGTQLAVACESNALQLWDLRAVRQQLAQIGLDWDHPPYPPAKPDAPNRPLRMELDPSIKNVR